MKEDAYIITIAYPENYVVIPNKWYKKALSWLGISAHGMFKGGHAALALISKQGEVFYADFGRYICPKGFGRVRTKKTDPELQFSLKAKWENEQLSNLEEILIFLGSNPDKTHGEGVMYASVCKSVNFQATLAAIEQIQNQKLIPYNPFGKKNTNCSRFVQDVLVEGVINKRLKKRIRHRKLISISPLGNVINADTESNIFKMENGILQSKVTVKRLSVFFSLIEKMEKPPKIKEHFDKPQISNFIPANATWLGGTGSGAWFQLSMKDNYDFIISRYERTGLHIFTGFFQPNKLGFDVDKPFQFVHPSTAQQCKVFQSKKEYLFNRVNDQDLITAEEGLKRKAHQVKH